MSFAYKASIKIDHTKVPNTDQTNFPIGVIGTYAGVAGAPDLRTAGNGGQVRNSNGYDIQFFSDAALTTRIPAEREYYNASTGQVVFWVQKTLLTASDVTIYIAFGDSTISTDPNSDATYGKNPTWRTEFKAVYHLPDGTTEDYSDSTSNANNLTRTGSTSPTGVTGQIDGAANFATANTDYAQCSESSSLQFGTGSLSVSFWTKWTINGNQYLTLFYNTSSKGFRIQRSGTGMNIRLQDGTSVKTSTATGAVNDGNWHLINAVYDTSAKLVHMYKDGTEATPAVDTTGLGSLTDANGKLTLANLDNITTGASVAIDEARLYGGVTSADWVTTSYNNQNSPSTFYTMGVQTPTGNTSGFFF
jgi:biopolymer transport protein ExbB